MRPAWVAVSIGCPSGIGPEVSVEGADRARGARSILVGDRRVIEQAAELRGVRDRLVRVQSIGEARRTDEGTVIVWGPSQALGSRPKAGRPDADAGRAQLAWIDQATELAARGDVDALVTGPVSKHAIASSGARGSRSFLGHTEHLAKKLRAEEVTMAFVSDRLTVALVTTHLALAKVPRAITKESVARATYWLARLLVAMGKRAPHLLVASLNPHAGEGGLLGSEETDRVAPGIALAQNRLEREGHRARVDGPIGAETAMRRAANGAVDGVVAMYHDQATIPTKVLAFGDAVNATLGLPIVRTSVDHGTAYDVAWKNLAEAGGMTAAIELGAKLARSKRPPISGTAPRPNRG